MLHTLIMFVIVCDPASCNKYKENIESIRLYSDNTHITGTHSYRVTVLDIEPEWSRDWFFVKHRMVWNFMMETSAEWIVVLDGDTAVINPQGHDLYTDYIKNTNADVIHYMREHNNEVMAGNYIVRNTDYGRAYVKDWSELRPEDKGVHHAYPGWNADNGALHYLLLWKLGGLSMRDKCNTAQNYEAYVRCFHMRICHLFRARNSNATGNIHVYPHGHGWAYDGWLTYYKWSNATFMMHAMKVPPIIEPTCCTRPLQGYVLPTNLSKHYVHPDEYNSILHESRLFERQKRLYANWEVYCLSTLTT